MAYAGQADIEKYLSIEKLAGLTSDTNVPDPAVIIHVLVDVSAEIDRWVGKRYNVPLATTPEAVKLACVDMAIYRLFLRREEVLGGVPESRKAAYDKQIEWLKSVAKGDATLGEIPEQVAVNVDTTPEYEADSREFTKDMMKGW